MHCSCVNGIVTEFTISWGFSLFFISLQFLFKIIALVLVHCSFLPIAVHSMLLLNVIWNSSSFWIKHTLNICTYKSDSMNCTPTTCCTAMFLKIRTVIYPRIKYHENSNSNINFQGKDLSHFGFISCWISPHFYKQFLYWLSSWSSLNWDWKQLWTCSLVT